ncbi:dopamine receptor 4 [Hydra vulgaris]|uniref:dopamine receptor 4 n=1 Tax=Hydra vulgaris TaxID=6087 RepID=UPI001F5E6EB3|nr:dopamine receptor 4-like [Hydra vulgaris]
MKKSVQFRWFVVHLAIADCLYAVVSPIYFIYTQATNNTWNIGKELCKILTVSGPLSVNVSAWVLCLMGYERYRAICHPFARRFSRKVIHISVVIIWIACMGLKTLIFIRTNVLKNECYTDFYNEMEQTISALVSLLVESVIPIIFLSYYLVRVTITMRKRSNFFEMNDNNSMSIKKKSKKTSNSFNSNEIGSKTYVDEISLSKKKSSKNFLKASFCFNNICTKRKSITEIEMVEHNAENPETLKKTKTSKRLSFRRIKYSVTNYVTRKSTLTKADRETVIVFILAVFMFILTTLPCNVNYFVSCYLFSFHFNKEQILKYGPIMYSVNDWLGLLVLSGSLSNVIIYSGRFSEFRHQVYIWANNVVAKLLKVRLISER